MPLTTAINFEEALPNSQTTYTDASGKFSLQLQSGGGMQVQTSADPLIGHYLLGISNQTFELHRADPTRSFGAVSVDLDGFVTSSTASGYQSSVGPITVTFTAFKADAQDIPLVYVAHLNVGALPPVGTSGFEHVVFPSDWASGLSSLSWSVSDGVDTFGAIDNLILVPNTPPVAQDVLLAIPGGTSAYTGSFLATDADGDRLTYNITNVVGGSVTQDGAGHFTVASKVSDQDLENTESRVVTFQYTANDGSESSAPHAVTVTIKGYQTFCGSLIFDSKYQHPNTLAGGDGNDTILGMQNNDTLSGGRGDDVLIGDNDRDYLDGGLGRDTLCGGNGDDTLVGGRGADFLSAGSGKDTFVFDRGSGNDVLSDFDGKQDHLRFLGVYTGYSDAMAHAVQSGANVVFNYTGDDGEAHHLTLLDVKLSSLHSSDFLFS